MANILSSITNGKILNIVVDVITSLGLGTPAPVGSIATVDNGGGIYVKNSSLDTDWIRGGVLGIKSITSTYQILESDFTLNCNGTFTITLPTSIGIRGQIYNIKNNGTGLITVNTTSGQLIDSKTSQRLFSGSSLEVQSTGLGWIII